jgi:hypothetical protein
MTKSRGSARKGERQSIYNSCRSLSVETELAERLKNVPFALSIAVIMTSGKVVTSHDMLNILGETSYPKPLIFCYTTRVFLKHKCVAAYGHVGDNFGSVNGECCSTQGASPIATAPSLAFSVTLLVLCRLDWPSALRWPIAKPINQPPYSRHEISEASHF